MDNQIQFIDVYDVWYAPWWRSAYFYMAIGLLLSIVFFLLVYKSIKKYRSRVKVLSYDQKALVQLQEILKNLDDDQKKLHEVYFQLTDILKEYFSHRYNLTLVDKTDQQVFELLEPHLDKESSVFFASFFVRIFEIKFAQLAVVKKVAQTDVEFCIKYIDDAIKNPSVKKGDS